MFGRRRGMISLRDAAALTDIVTSIAELKGTIDSLRTEVKLLREERDAWKEVALGKRPMYQDRPL